MNNQEAWSDKLRRMGVEHETTATEQNRWEIERAVAKFLRNGGKITQIPPGITGHPDVYRPSWSINLPGSRQPKAKKS